MTPWLTVLKKAKKTSIQHGNIRKVHYGLPHRKEMLEEYNMDTGVVVKRAWKVGNGVCEKEKWSVEIGDSGPRDLSEEPELIKENSNEPFVSRRTTKRNLEWRIRNLPYPIETYSVTADPSNKCITVRTTNKKYFKNLAVPEFERLNLEPEQSQIEYSHKYNTLIITYKKPQEMKNFEEALFAEIKVLKTANDGDAACRQLKALYSMCLQLQ